MKKWILMMISAILSQTALNAQEIRNQDKIDPVFRNLIEQKRSIEREAEGRKKKRCRKKALNKANSKIYSCIVYTKDAKALKEKGITINSVLPTFVTAMATLDQICLMADLPGVTYIEAPGHDGLHKQ